MKTEFKPNRGFSPQQLISSKSKSPKSKALSVPYLIGLIIIAIFGTVGTLWLLGYMDLPFLNRQAWERQGKIPVPITRMAIPAYSKVTRDYIDFMYFDPERAPTVAIQDLKKIIGRVVDRNKPAGYVFTRSDFAPKGTRAGLVAGIPAGKRAFTLNTSKVSGFYGLKVGDHMDIIGTLRLDQKKGKSIKVAGGSGFLADTHLLAQDAVIVSPLRNRKVPVTNTSLTRGTVTRNRTVQEAIIAISPHEVQTLAQALAMNAEIMVVPRSGQPQSRESSNPSNKKKQSNSVQERFLRQGSFHLVETIKGSKRERMMVPSNP